jgi:hypothetical protein
MARARRHAPVGHLIALFAMSCTGGVGGDAPAGGTGDCVGGRVVTQKRVVRLSEHQLRSSYDSLFGLEAAAIVAENEELTPLTEREFPPVSGEIGVSEGLFHKYDRLARSAMKYVSENAAALTPCGDVPSDAECVRHYLLSLAEQAFRHPLTVEERSALTVQFWTEMMASGASVAQALAYGVYGVLSSPSFIYRTEFGSDVAADGRLTPHELATAISLFLSDAPPDAELLAAAAEDRLATRDQVRAQARRILAKPEARQNLELALLQYFSLAKSKDVILNPEVTPGLSVTSGLKSAIYREGELFLKNLLWSGPLSALLTSRQTWTNAQVATQIYGVAQPSQVDADGFGMVELSADRSGLFTLSTFLLSGARSTGGSPVTRGLAVNRSIACDVNPPFPMAVNPSTGELEGAPEVTSAIAMLADESELVKARYRAGAAQCAGCHLGFDAFGMVLEPYDAIGRFRTVDLEGRPIEATWTTTALPDSVGGALVTNAAEAARALAARGVLDRCLAMNFINYALTEVSRGGANNTDLGRAPQTGSCAVQGVLEHFLATDRSFSSLMVEIAASDTLAVRSRGE